MTLPAGSGARRHSANEIIRRKPDMAISKGDRVPSVELSHMGAEGPAPITTEVLFGGKKVVLFAVPGAFTPTCSAAHLPGFVVNADEVKARGVDDIVCLSVNDAFVMDAWGKAQNAEAIHMVADGSGAFTRAVGLELDLVARGLGVRSQRYAMIVDDGVVSEIRIDDGGKLEVSSAEAVLELL
jgi:peroxiredoxin